MKKFILRVVEASEFNSPAAVADYLTMLVAFVAGLALFVMTLATPALTLVANVIGAALMWPYVWGLIWRVQHFHAAKGSWLALLSALI